jgi:large subunit ribosomal protein L18
MKRIIEKQKRRNRRKIHIRKRIKGTAECPRLSVFRSNRHLYLQAIDDVSGKTLAAISSLEKDFLSLKNNLETGAKLGEAMGKRLNEQKVSTVVFDRNGYKYHGIVKALADGVRKAGIEF